MSSTHTFVNGQLLKKCPPEINESDWDIFLCEMERADNLELNDHPVQIDIELNSGCNMNCPFCRHGFEKVVNKNADIERYKKLVDEAVQFGAKSLKLNYINEPLMRKDLEDFIAYSKNAGILNIYLVTNGTMLTESRRKKLIQSGITKIFISIDAITPETYNLQRLDGRYRLVVENVCALIRERNALGLTFPIIRVSFLKNSLNIHEAGEFQDFWENKADLIAFQKMNEVPDQETGLVINKDNLPEKGCSFPFKQLVVDADGDILPCCTLYGKSLAIGNIANMSLRDAWNSNKMKNLRQAHQTDDWKKLDICLKCMAGE